MDDFTVEAVVGKRAKKGGRIEYLVKWEGYGKDENT
eukprot:SAG22_NODE_2144_length_2941_cov_2.511963_3_plen_35_part_01